MPYSRQKRQEADRRAALLFSCLKLAVAITMASASVALYFFFKDEGKMKSSDRHPAEGSQVGTVAKDGASAMHKAESEDGSGRASETRAENPTNEKAASSATNRLGDPVGGKARQARRQQPQRIKHPAHLANRFSAEGSWEIPAQGELSDFVITEFAGFEIGSSMYCPEGLSLRSSFRSEDGREIPSSVVRSTLVDLGQPVFGYTVAEIQYTCESKELFAITLSSTTFGNTKEAYDAEVAKFQEAIRFLMDRYGMPEPPVHGNDDNFVVDMRSDNTRVIARVNVYSGKESQSVRSSFSIIDTRLMTVDDEASRAAIENKTTPQIKKWVEDLEANPRYSPYAGRR